jgi:hypothetical protein
MEFESFTRARSEIRDRLRNRLEVFIDQKKIERPQMVLDALCARWRILSAVGEYVRDVPRQVSP